MSTFITLEGVFSGSKKSDKFDGGFIKVMFLGGSVDLRYNGGMSSDIEKLKEGQTVTVQISANALCRMNDFNRQQTFFVADHLLTIKGK